MRSRAITMLLLATAAWGSSFPLMKAIQLALAGVLPDRATWLFSSLLIAERFALGALVLWIVKPRAFAQARASEWRQGIGLGVCAALGMLFQADGLAYTEASTSAFLTQFTCALVPLAMLARYRRAPSWSVIVAVLLVLAGVAVLARFDWRAIHLGRGEVETLVGTAFFTAQIIWLGRAIFRGNDTHRVSLIMFATIALTLTPAVLLHLGHPSDLALLAHSVPIFTIFLALTLVCSLFAFLMMNHWQPYVDPTTAGIIYCAEPLFATVMALFLPAWLSGFASIAYENETMTPHLLIGGALITAANILIVVKPGTDPRDAVRD